MTTNINGLALDAWIGAIPDDVYDPCPCGCGNKFRYIAKDDNMLQKHEETFIRNFIASSQSRPASGRTSGPPCSASKCPACGLGEHGRDALCDHHYAEYLGQHMGSHSDMPEDGQTFYTPNAELCGESASPQE